MSIESTPTNRSDERSLRHRLLQAIEQIERGLAAVESNESSARFRSDWFSPLLNDDCHGALRVVTCPPGRARRALAACLIADFLKVTERVSTLAWFCLGEPAVDAVLRLLCVSAGLPPDSVAEGQRRLRRDLVHLTETAGRLAKYPVLIDDSAGLTVPDIREQCHRWAETHGWCQPIVIDGVEELIGESGGRWGEDPGVAEEIAEALRKLASELSVPVLVIATGQSELPDRSILPEPLTSRANLATQLEVGETDNRTDVAPAVLRFLKGPDEAGEEVVSLMFRPGLMRFDEVIEA